MTGWFSSRRRRLPAILAVLLVASCAGPGLPSRQASLSIPVRNDDGTITDLVGLVCRPAGDAPATVVVINHGSPSSAERPFERLASCDDEAPSWFTQRGFVVVQALRRGYGATGGPWAESYGSCRDPDYVDAGLQSARDIGAVVDAATALPYARPDGAVVVGQSAGGWGTLAYGSQPHPKVAALIAIAPGRGGHRDGDPNDNCAPERLVEAAGRFGRTSRSGILWVNTRNDSYFDPTLVRQMQAAFTAHGGVLTTRHLGDYGRDGHKMFFGDSGSGMWGPVVADYLTTKGITTGTDGPVRIRASRSAGPATPE